MAEPMSTVSPEKLNTSSHSIYAEEDDMTWHDPPSSPFISHVDNDQENIAPAMVAPTPMKQLIDFGESVPQSAFKISPTKDVMKERNSPVKMSPSKQLLAEFEDASFKAGIEMHDSPKKNSPVKAMATGRPESASSDHSRKHVSPAKSSRTASVESVQRHTQSSHSATLDILPSPGKSSSLQHTKPMLRENEGLTVAMRIMEEVRSESHRSTTTYGVQADALSLEELGVEDTEYNPDGPDLTSMTIDDTCFSAFSEMPNVDMTNFAALRKSPTKNGLFDQATPRARALMTPSTTRRTERTPSPTPRRSRKDNDTTNLLLDFTAQIEAFSSSRRGSPSRGRTSPTRTAADTNLLTYIQSQRSPGKTNPALVPATPSQNRQLLNLLDFELPPPPTPRSLPTVTIRELESLKSTLQSQISSLTASLSGREAEVESLGKAVADAERRVGEAQEIVRDERSAREHAEAQMTDWKKKGEEVQRLLQDVQSELARNDAERESLLVRLAEAERRADDAETRCSDLETRAIEAESKNVDMTTFVNPAEDEENKKIYSEAECQAAIAEKINDVARDLHTAYKAKHEKKIKALKESYHKKADDRCKELRVQIIRLERQVEEAEKKRDDTFSKVLPPEFAALKGDNAPTAAVSDSENLKKIEEHKAEIESLKAKLAGLQSELSSLKSSHDTLTQELEAERVEKGELVAAAEQMLSLCGEKMEEIQQEELRKSRMGGGPPSAPPEMMRSTGFMAAPPASMSRPGSALGGGRPGSAMGERLGAMTAEKGSGIAKPSGLRAPGGFGLKQSGPALNRSTSGGNKSRLMSNIERMGSGRAQE